MREQIGWQASGRGGAVAAGGAASVEAGLRILEDGGNAVDAAVATILALAVTDYGLFAIGGEVPLMVYASGSRRVRVLSGVGRAPLDADAIADFYAEGIPDDGSYLAMPAPGAPHLCLTALTTFGTMSFERVVAPTMELLEAGEKDWHGPLARTLRRLTEAARITPGSREEKLLSARDRFYWGDIAVELAEWYEEVGSPLTAEDLAAHVTTIEEPVSVEYRGLTVDKCGPWTQGPVLAQTLRLLEGTDLTSMQHLSADYVHIVTEAMKLAYADRDEFYADPEFTGVPLPRLLSDEYTIMRRSLIDAAHASTERRPGDPYAMQPLSSDDGAEENEVRTPISDTTTCVVSDRWGNVVAATPSCNLVGNRPDPRTGVTQGNRLRCMNTMPGHPNCLEPGKRPRLTLTPTLVTRDGRPVAAISVAGGDLQDQTTLNVLLNHVEFGMNPAEAVTAPRFSTDHMENSFDSNPDRAQAFKAPGSLQVNEEISEGVRKELAARGHAVSVTEEAIAMPVMLAIDEDGTFHAAGDPAAGRHAGALDGK
ncbi:MAG: gamma-glutamyltransferase family protein [Armatimonadota bacterium]